MQENKMDAQKISEIESPKTFKQVIKNSLKNLDPFIFHPDKEENEIYEGLNGLFKDSVYFKSEILTENGNPFLQIALISKKYTGFRVRIYASSYRLDICIINFRPSLINTSKYNKNFYPKNLFLDIHPFENILISYLEELAVLTYEIERPSTSEFPSLGK